MSDKLKHSPPKSPSASRESLNSVMRRGGVTLQNILWRRLSNQKFSPVDCTLPLTLDLLGQNSLGSTSRSILSNALPAFAQPIVVYGAAPIMSPPLELETLNEIILTGNSVGVEPQLHTIRIKSKHHNSTDLESAKTFDTVLFCSGIVVGNSPLIIGAAFLGEADRDDTARTSLRQLMRQLCADQIAMTDMIQRCLELPHLARVMIGGGEGEIIWSNGIAARQWDTHASTIKYLAQVRNRVDESETAESKESDSRRVTIITLLRSRESRGSESSSLHSLQKFDLGDEVRARLNRVIEATLSEKMTVAERNDAVISPTSPEINSAATLPSNSEQHNDSYLIPFRNSEDSIMDSIEVESESQLATDNRPGHFEEARTALEIALRHLPVGGCLKLSPINSKGEVRLESFDKDGKETVDITLRDKTFMDSDDFL